MERSDTSSGSTVSDTVDFYVHDLWHPMMEIPFHVQNGGIFKIYVEGK